MGLKSALFGDDGDDYLTEYTKKRMKQEAAKKAKKQELGKAQGGRQQSGQENIMALNDEYDSE